MTTMRRFICATLLVSFCLQTTGAAAAGPLSAAGVSATFAQLQFDLRNSANWLVQTQIVALITAPDRYAAMHAAPPVFVRPSFKPPLHIDTRELHREPRGLRSGVLVRPPGLPLRPVAPNLAVRDPRAMLAPARGTPPPTRLQRMSVQSAAQAITAQALTTVTNNSGTTGINRWWTYEERGLPGVGKYLVNAANGNLIVQAADVDIPERGIDLAFVRTYNSMSQHTYANADGSTQNIFGEGWTNNFDAHIAFYNSGQTLSVYDIDGTRYDYTANGNGGWTPPPGMAGTSLTLATTGTFNGNTCYYQWTKKSGTAYVFYRPDFAAQGCGGGAGFNGRLAQIFARNSNNWVRLDYSWNNGDSSTATNITKIVATHADGHTLALNFWRPANNGGYTELSSIVLPDGNTTIAYYYNPNVARQLQEVDRPDNGSNGGLPIPELYSYSSAIDLYYVASPRYVCAARMLQCANGKSTDGDETIFHFTPSGQLSTVYHNGVVNFTPADGTAALLQPGTASGFTTYGTDTYSYGTGQTTFTDSDGHKSAWTYDGVGRVTQTQDWPNPNQSFALVTTASWDTDGLHNNNLVETIDARNQATDYAYDTSGNTIAVALPSVTTNAGTLRPTGLYSYDVNASTGQSYNNVLASCDPVFVGSAGYDWTNRPTSDSLCPSVSTVARGSTHYLWDHSDPNEPFGRLSDTYTPMGYHAHITYDTCAQCAPDAGLPTNVQGDAIAQATDPTTPTRTPTQTFTYDGYGNLLSYDKGKGPWQLTYDTSTLGVLGLNRLLSSTDPDGYTSYMYYNSDGSVKKTETPYQHATGTGGTVAYDADGNQTQQTAYHGGAYNASGSTPTLPNASATTKYYDGADRLVEVQQPYDPTATGEAYTKPWITRYFYDLSQNHSTGATPTVGGTGVYAYGNLFKTIELVPPSDTVTFSPSVPLGSVANTQWNDVKGNAFDALDRAVTRYYFFVVNSADTLQHETYTYDSDPSNPLGSNTTGELSSDCNGVNQCIYYAYDNDAKLLRTQHTASSSLDRTFGFDPDGRTVSVTLPSYGTQTYAYKPDGMMWRSIEPSGMDSAATLTNHFYADGKRSSLDVSSARFSQAGLFTYAYRTDGKLETQQIVQPSNALVGTTALTFTYSAAGRLQGRTESGTGANATPSQFSYDPTYGYLTQISYPAAKESNLQYDPTGSLLGQQASTQTVPSTYTYSVRGELLSSAGPAAYAQVYGKTTMANGVGITPNTTMGWTWTGTTIDPRMGVVLASSSMKNGSTSSTSVSFDALGRVTTDETDSCNYDCSDGSTTSIARTYDQDNHLLTTNVQPDPGVAANSSYDWGVSGHPIRIGGSCTTAQIPNCPANGTMGYETLHWDGDQLLFTTSANGLDDIKIGEIGDITPQDPTYKGLTFWDRDASQSVVYCHNASGAAGNGLPAYSFSGARGITISHNPCQVSSGQSMTTPSSVLWTTNPEAKYNPYRIGWNAVLGMPRGDGFTDGFNTIQGVRVYDSTLGGWATPDAYQGDVHDPMSQKSYVWNGSNPIAYSDPTGYYEQALFVDAQDFGSTNGVKVDDGSGSAKSCDGVTDPSGACHHLGDTIADPGADKLIYNNSDDATKAADKAYSSLKGDAEVGAVVYCRESKCAYGPAIVGTSDKGGNGYVPFDLNPYKGADKVTVWHRHPPNTDVSFADHNLSANDLFAKFRWLRSTIIYTTIGGRIYWQPYAGIVPEDSYNPPMLLP